MANRDVGGMEEMEEMGELVNLTHKLTRENDSNLDEAQSILL